MVGFDLKVVDLFSLLMTKLVKAADQMKKAFLFLSVFLICGSIGCTNSKSENMKSLVGKWQRETGDQTSLVLELTSQGEWKYHRDGEMIEEGTFVVEGSKFILKHKASAHQNDDGTTHTHDHETAPDHVYEFSLNSDKNQLELMHGDQTSVYIKQ